MDAAGNASSRTIDMPRPAAFGGVRLSSRYSSDTGGAMLLTNANRDRPYSSSKLPKRAGQVFYGKKTYVRAFIRVAALLLAWLCPPLTWPLACQNLHRECVRRPH